MSKTSRIFLLPGFGEDHRCYRNLVPRLRSDFQLIHVDYRPALNNFPLWETKPKTMARSLMEYYNIQPNDKLVGHSMGGYFSYAISTIQGNPVAMLGSYSDASKIVRMTQNKFFNYSFVGTGLIKTPLMKLYISHRTNNKQFLPEMLEIQDNFQSFSNTDMLKMLQLSYGGDLPPPSTQPYRIHALDDAVVRPPDEAFHEVPGGHFSLVFHPDEVLEKLQPWLGE
jgi:hypothetical protein